MVNKTLHQARTDKGWTQEELAAKSGIDQRVISKIELGKTDDPQNSTVRALEKALRLRRGTLVFGHEAVALVG